MEYIVSETVRDVLVQGCMLCAECIIRDTETVKTGIQNVTLQGQPVI